MGCRGPAVPLGGAAAENAGANVAFDPRDESSVAGELRAGVETEDAGAGTCPKLPTLDGPGAGVLAGVFEGAADPAETPSVREPACESLAAGAAC